MKGKKATGKHENVFLGGGFKYLLISLLPGGDDPI